MRTPEYPFGAGRVARARPVDSEWRALRVGRSARRRNGRVVRRSWSASFAIPTPTDRRSGSKVQLVYTVDRHRSDGRVADDSRSDRRLDGPLRICGLAGRHDRQGAGVPERRELGRSADRSDQRHRAARVQHRRAASDRRRSEERQRQGEARRQGLGARRRARSSTRTDGRWPTRASRCRAAGRRRSRGPTATSRSTVFRRARRRSSFASSATRVTEIRGRALVERTGAHDGQDGRLRPDARGDARRGGAGQGAGRRRISGAEADGSGLLHGRQQDQSRIDVVQRRDAHGARASRSADAATVART